MTPYFWLIQLFFISNITCFNIAHADDTAKEHIEKIELRPLKNDHILHAEDVLKSAHAFFPEILEQIQTIEAVGTDIQAAEGAFDTNLEQNYYSWERGFYDGTATDTKITQPLEDLNSDIFIGYRTSRGNFPVYEDELWVNDEEYYIGARLALLRDRDIDQRRADLSISEWKLDKEKAKLIAIKLKVQEAALKRYWKWVTAGHKLKTFQALLKLAETRQTKLKKRVKSGDIAEIFLQEGEQYILKRQADVTKAKNLFENAAIALSFYYRDGQGKPSRVFMRNLPKDYALPDRFVGQIGDNEAKIRNRPEFQMLALQRKMTEQQKALAENNLLPFLDLELKSSKDNGSGSPTREEGEVTIGLQLKVPLQRNIAKANLAKQQAFLTRLSYSEKLQIEKLQNRLQKLQADLRNNYDLFYISQKEVKFARIMSKAEEKRFLFGSSDFFTLNRREEDIASSQIRVLRAQESYYKAIAEYYALIADFDNLYIE
ncbi:MAG: TolC family protein [Pseudomonadota bacterium]